MAGKMSLGNPYEPHLEQLIEMLVEKQPADREQLIEMFAGKQSAIIKEIKPEKDLDEGCGVPPLWEFYPEPEEMNHPPQPNLWYLITVLKKSAFFI